MTLQQFYNNWNGKYLSILSPGKQCFDLVVQWARDNGVPNYPGHPSMFPYQYAYQIYLNFGEFQARYFERIPNGPLNSPQPGDTMVWKPGYNGGAGHTAVVLKGGVWTFDAFSQNDPTGSRCITKNYSYGYLSSRGVYGWLRLKPQEQTCEQQLQQIRNQKNNALNILNRGTLSDSQKVIEAKRALGG